MKKRRDPRPICRRSVEKRFPCTLKTTPPRWVGLYNAAIIVTYVSIYGWLFYLCEWKKIQYIITGNTIQLSQSFTPWLQLLFAQVSILAAVHSLYLSAMITVFYKPVMHARHLASNDNYERY